MKARGYKAVSAGLAQASGRHSAGLQTRPRRTAIAAAVASCFAASTAFANPSGMTVVSGSASASVSGNTLSITNSPGAILNWQAFSIGQNEVTRFLQQSAASSVLNRVTGGNPSQILGTLQSNGKVFLINPSGILFGAGAQIDVAGLVASTLNLSNEDFLAGRMRFTETVGAGSVINNGAIRTTQGGNVYLIAPDVQNTGLITSPKGEVVLAAGKSVELVEPGTPGLRVEISAPNNQALNMGQIVADSGRIGIYAGLVRNSGTIRADSVSTDAAGRIVLKASRDTTLEAGSVLSANGPAGGSVTVQSGGTTIVSGTIDATGSTQQGGSVQVLGNLVGLGNTAAIDASGASGGGTVLVGGDFQGANDQVQNAFRTFVSDGAVVKADALASGDGGKVIVWADDITRFYGSVSARGGAAGGNGGFVEISGKRLLDFNGRVDVGAPKGAAGTILFDPDTITIVPGTGPDDGEVSDGQINFADGGEGANFVIGEAALEALSGNIILQANHDITVNPGLTGGGLVLTTDGQGIEMQAGANITIGSAIATNNGQIKLWAGHPGAPAPSSTATLAVNADLSSGNADIYLASSGSGGITVAAGKSITSDAHVQLQADKLAIASATQIRGYNVSIWPWNFSDISLGSSGSGLRLTQADLNVLRTDASGVLYIGDYLQTANIAITSAINFSAVNTPTVQLYAGNGSISQGGSAPVTADSLALYAGYGSVNMQASNQVNTLAGAAYGGDFKFKNAQSLTVGSVGDFNGINADGAEGSPNVAININVTSGGLTVNRAITAYGSDGGEGVGGNASIVLSAANGVSINRDDGGNVYARGASGDTGGNASITINGGSGGVSIQGEGGEGYGTVHAEGGYGYSGDGGAASVTITSTGSSSIMLDDTSVVAQGGYSDYDTGGAATIAMTSGSGGIVSSYSTVQAWGGGTYDGAGGAASISMNGGSGGVSITGDGAEGSAVYARGGDGYFSGGGAASATVSATGGGSILVDSASIESRGGHSEYGNGGNATTSVTSGTSGGTTLTNAYVTASGGDSYQGDGGSATVAVGAGSGGILQDNSSWVSAYGGEGGDGGEGTGNGATASVSFNTSGAIQVTNGSVVEVFGGDGAEGGSGGNASLAMSAGSSGINLYSSNVFVEGGNGSADGGNATITWNTSGGVFLDYAVVEAFGGGSVDFGNGGNALVSVTAGNNGVSFGSDTIVGAFGGGGWISAGAGKVAMTTGGTITMGTTNINNINVSGRENSGSDSGIFLNANRIDGGEGHLNAVAGQLIKLTAVNGIGSEWAPVRIANNDPDVQASNSSSGDVALSQIHGDINIDNFPVTNNANGAGIFVIAEDGNINVTVPVINSKGAITLRSKLSGGTITVDGGEGNNGSVTSGGGRDVYLYADNMSISGPVQASSGFVTASVNTSGREIWLGSSGGGGSALELSNDELNLMTAIGGNGGGLIIGQTGDTPIIIKGPISPSAFPNLRGTTLTQDPGATVTGGINMDATGDVTLTDAGNMIDLFGATTPGNASVTTASNLLLGTIDVGGNLNAMSDGTLNTWSLSGPIDVGGLTNLAAVNGIGTTSDPLRTTSSGAGFTATNTGAGGINVLSSAATFTVGGGGASFDNSGGGGYQIQSTGNMNVSGTLATDADALFSAAGIMNVSGYSSGFDAGFSGAAVNFSGSGTNVGGALKVVAGDVNVTNVSVDAGTVTVLASNLNVVSTGGTASLSSNGGNFTGIIGNNINVTGGMAGGNASIYGSPDVNLTVGGAIYLTANAGTAKIEANLPTTINILFPFRSSGGYFINGVENLVWDDLTSTGFFAGGAPAILGSTLLITYGISGLSNEVLSAINFINAERQRAVDLGILPEDEKRDDDKKAPGICR